MAALTRRQFVQRTALSGLALGLSACGGRDSFLLDSRSNLLLPRGLHASFEGPARSSRSLTWFTDGLEAPPSLIEFDQAENLDAATPFTNRVEARSEATTGVEAFTHRARIDGLDPDKPLRYRVGSEQAWSDTRIIPATPSDTWRFVHFGDHGIGALPQQITHALLREQFDMLLLAGDLSYANGDQPIWDTWFDQMDGLMSRVPSMAAPGNHEEKDFGGDAFKNRFTHPKSLTHQLSGQSASNSFYSFECNRVHVLVTTAGALINDGTLPEEIINIELDLARAAARRAAGEIDFIIVMQHFTIWTDQLGRSPANLTLVALEENIIVRYGVDMILVGHDHVYQRSVPMAFGLPNPLGYVQMMVGTGGQSIRLFDDNGPQAWSARQFVGIGYARYEVSGRVIRGEFVGAPPVGLDDENRQAVAEELRVVDSFEIHARGPDLARMSAVPARDKQTLLRDFDAIAQHTKERNKNALRHCA